MGNALPPFGLGNIAAHYENRSRLGCQAAAYISRLPCPRREWNVMPPREGRGNAWGVLGEARRPGAIAGPTRSLLPTDSGVSSRQLFRRLLST